MKKRKRRHYVVPPPKRVPEPLKVYFKLPAALSTYVQPLPKSRNIFPKRGSRSSKAKISRFKARGIHAVNINEPVGFQSGNNSAIIYDDFSVPQTHTSTHYFNIGNNTRVGIINPRWKDQTRLGQNATTPMSGTEFEAIPSFWSGYSIGSSWFKSTGQRNRNWSYVSSGFPAYQIPVANSAPPNVIADVSNRCIRKFIQEVSEAQSSDNLTGRSIKHFKHDVHSTLHPMAGIQKKISRYLTSLEKVPYGKLKGASLYSTITQAYLEFKFGVEPFVDDITAIVTDMVIKDRKRNPSIPVESTAHASYLGTVDLVSFLGDSGLMSPFQPQMYRQITSTYYMRLKGALRTGVNDDGRLGFVQDNKLLPKDWIPTAFSIMPYAWMVNYFTNIRDIIDAASFRFSDLVWGCQTTRDETVYTFSGVRFNIQNPFDAGSPNIGWNYATVCSGGHATFKARSVTRSSITPASLMPSFAFSIPTSPTPWVNMMAAFSPRIAKVVTRLFS
jgi:hypothetical protein